MKLNIAIAAEFELCEKIAESLAQSELNIEKLSVIEIFPFGEEQGVRFRQRAVAQIAVNETNWAEFDYLFFAGDATQAAQIANAAEAGCIVIDMKGVTAAIAGVPVVVPTVNEQDIIQVKQRNIVAMPDPQITQLVLALAQTLQTQPINALFVSSMLPASYHEGDMVSKLAGQTARLLNGIPLDENEQRLAFDVFPQSTTSLNAQYNKIFPNLNVIFHAVQSPVFYGLAQKITVISDYEFDLESMKSHWQEQENVVYEESLITPVLNGEKEASEERVALRISQAKTLENRLEFWTVADEQRFSLAYLAVKLLETLCKS